VALAPHLPPASALPPLACACLPATSPHVPATICLSTCSTVCPLAASARGEPSWRALEERLSCNSDGMPVRAATALPRSPTRYSQVPAPKAAAPTLHKGPRNSRLRRVASQVDGWRYCGAAHTGHIAACHNVVPHKSPARRRLAPSHGPRTRARRGSIVTTHSTRACAACISCSACTSARAGLPHACACIYASPPPTAAAPNFVTSAASHCLSVCARSARRCSCASGVPHPTEASAAPGRASL